ncbi:hypothetical protein TcBrA4_0066790 [Trypanosoma cruzi]|nr:hypothetical protein TcBrA4_0066790 [Trypanosoma cruzi]
MPRPRATASLHAEETLASQFAEFKQKHGRVYGRRRGGGVPPERVQGNLFLRGCTPGKPTREPSASRPSRTSRARNSGPRYHNGAAHFAAAQERARVPVNVGGCWCARGSGLACERRRDSRQGPGPMRFVLGLLRHWQRWSCQWFPPATR